MLKTIGDALDRHPQWKMLIGIVLVVIFFSLFGFRGSRAAVRITVQENDFILSYSDRFECKFSKDDILSVELAEQMDFGTPVQVISEGKYLVGKWGHAEYGEYCLAVKKSTDAYIVVHTTDEVYVFNYDNEKQTEAVYQALLEWKG